MNCIVCKKDILPLYEPEGEPNPDYVPRKGMDELVNSTMWNDATVDFLHPGYGSCHDFEKIRIAVCDSCITQAIADGTAQQCGSYF